jgi:hypothetical protein
MMCASVREGQREREGGSDGKRERNTSMRVTESERDEREKVIEGGKRERKKKY